MVIDSSINIGNIITASGTMISCIATAVWAKITISRMEAVMFEKNGEVRLVSFTAHERMQGSCRKNLAIDIGHAEEDMQRLEKQNDRIMSILESLGGKLDKLQKCMVVINYGGKLEDCDK